MEPGLLDVLLLLLVVGGLTAAWWILRGWRGVSWRARLLPAALLLLLPTLLFVLWTPEPRGGAVFDRERNGLWISSAWYGGSSAPTGRPLAPNAIDDLLRTLRVHGIRDAYVRAGHITAEGELDRWPAPLFFELQARAPHVRFLPWLSGDAEALPMADAAWRERVVESLARLHAQGVRGIHLNLEPVRDGEAGYCALLKDIRQRFAGSLFVSQASRRVAPLGLPGAILRGRFWSAAFYRETMAASDQTVLMGYNTMLRSPKLYRAYMAHQTALLLDWASEVSGHELLIGIPAYEDLSELSDPAVENLPNAIAGVRVALERHAPPPSCFQGVAIYARWLTDPTEWRAFETAWRGQAPTRSPPDARRPPAR